MRAALCTLLCLGLVFEVSAGAGFTPAPQKFAQEVARSYTQADGLPAGRIQLIEAIGPGSVRAFAAGQWFELRNERWQKVAGLAPGSEQEFVFSGGEGQPVRVPVAWPEVRELVRAGDAQFVATAAQVFRLKQGKSEPLGWAGHGQIHQVAASADGSVYVASSQGLYRLEGSAWRAVEVPDGRGREWAVGDVLGVAVDGQDRLWFAVKAGVGCRTSTGWRFYEGKDGLPWNDFTGATAGTEGQVWFGTKLGAVGYDGKEWLYRQGRRWLPNDEVAQVAVDGQGTVWLATAGGVGSLGHRPMTLAEKAEFYEGEVEHYVKRTPFGYVAEAYLRRPGDKSSADPQDSDNDGLWTAMYGAGECFDYAATHDPKAKARARKAFEALRYLQTVTQGGPHSPPRGFIARTIRPTSWPDPNNGRLEQDRREQSRDKLWKVYEPRWPKSADGQWYWKSDTSSDELDGHYFFYPLYYDFCAETDREKDEVREVVRGVTDHLLTHGFALIDHDGKPTRWAVYGPQYLNHDPNWLPERGLNSLSLLTYLAAAAHVTGDAKYTAASRELIDQHSYDKNLFYPKLQHGPGSGNQSDDEMAFMCYYGILRCSRDEALKALVRYSFFNYWVNEAPELNPFFNFAYAGQNLDAAVAGPWGARALVPWRGWHEDSMATLYGFPLDRLNWEQRNSHRLDLVFLAPVHSDDIDDPDRPHTRGSRVNGRVLPIENRYFTQWNTDPWQLDYGGNGNELGAGTVFLLPYYLGLYHGFIVKPGR